MASVVSAEDIGGKRRYLLEDGTARIFAWQWIPKDDGGGSLVEELGDLDL